MSIITMEMSRRIVAFVRETNTQNAVEEVNDMLVDFEKKIKTEELKKRVDNIKKDGGMLKP